MFYVPFNCYGHIETGPWFNVLFERLEKPRLEHATPGLQGKLLKQYMIKDDISRVMRKPDFCLSENKGADQLRGNREADQHLCFSYSDSTIPLLLKSKISNF